MILVRDLIPLDGVLIDTTSKSKTAVLQAVSELIAKQHVELEVVSLFDSYWKRESLGSTAIGHGVLVPHVRTDLIETMSACLIKLQNPVDFGAEDKQPVDLVVGLVVSSRLINEHLEALSAMTRLFHQSEFRAACRRASSERDLFQLIHDARS